MAQTRLDSSDPLGSALQWFDEMVDDEAKAAKDYYAFADFLQGADFSTNEDFLVTHDLSKVKQLLEDTAIHVRAIARDEEKHHDVFQVMRNQFERYK